MYDNLVCSQLCGFESDFGLSSLPSKLIMLSAHLHNEWQTLTIRKHHLDDVWKQPTTQRSRKPIYTSKQAINIFETWLPLKNNTQTELEQEYMNKIVPR